MAPCFGKLCTQLCPLAWSQKLQIRRSRNPVNLPITGSSRVTQRQFDIVEDSRQESIGFSCWGIPSFTSKAVCLSTVLLLVPRDSWGTRTCRMHTWWCYTFALMWTSNWRACRQCMPKCALFRNFCMFVRNIFVYIGRGEMHFKNHKNGCLCVCVCVCALASFLSRVWRYQIKKK